MNNEKIQWQSEYAIGIKLIDKQHKKLFQLINRLYELNEHEITKDMIKSILYEFSDYMKTHFQDEEEYMASIEYDKFKEHKALHQELVDNLSMVIKTPAKLDIIKTKMKIVIKRGLLAHIIKEDIKIKEFQENNVSKIDIIKIDILEAGN